MTVLRRKSAGDSDDDFRPINNQGCPAERSFGSRDSLPTTPSTTSFTSRTVRHNPYAVVTEPYRKEPANVTYGVSHQPLLKSCYYIPFPSIRTLTKAKSPTLPASAVQLQIRQVRFEMETGQIRWLIRRLTGVHVIKAERVVPGIMHIWVRGTQDADRICNTMHQNILFDFQGVFAPLNLEQKEAVLAYTETRQFHTRSQRLPRELVAVTRMYAPPPPPPKSAGTELRRVG